MSLKVAPCEHKAADFAVKNWHYSKRMPIGKLILFGVWEDEKFIGSVMFGRGANNNLGSPYGLTQTEVCELVRVALTNHKAPVTQIVSECLKELKRTNPNMRLVVSYADPEQNHVGVIYQAGNWLYSGQSPSDVQHYYQGKWYHSRMLRPSGFGTHTLLSRMTKEQQKALPKKVIKGKHRYLYPLDKQMRRRLEKTALSYPHAVQGS